MKYVCLNMDACGHFEHVDLESLSQDDLINPFKYCTNCKYLMVLVENDFSFQSLDELKFLKNLN
jgi:hypothetical protein